METSDLISRLAAESTPVRRLPAPWLRALFWLAVAAPYVASVVMLGPMPHDLSPIPHDVQFMVEPPSRPRSSRSAASCPVMTVGCCCSRSFLSPYGSLPLGESCLRDWIKLGTQGLELRPDWGCLPSAAWIGIVPAIAMVIMLRRGAPLFPRATIALGGLAVAALANFGLRLFHLGDASIMVLFWHFGSVALLAALASLVGRRFLYWRHAAAGIGRT